MVLSTGMVLSVGMGLTIGSCSSDPTEANPFINLIDAKDDGLPEGETTGPVEWVPDLYPEGSDGHSDGQGEESVGDLEGTEGGEENGGADGPEGDGAGGDVDAFAPDADGWGQDGGGEDGGGDPDGTGETDGGDADVTPGKCNPPCGLGELCIGGDCICTPKCLGKECGDDGCGGLCGICPMGSECLISGTCSCVPNCEAKVCGDDGCGSSCGYCLLPDVCLDGGCVCIPDCTGKTCGDDGCGGSCGPCPPLHQCDQGTCSLYCPTCPNLGGNCPQTVHGDHMYYFCTSPRRWDKAVNKCEESGTHLVTISSPDENSFVSSLTGGAQVWLGYYESWFNWHWVNDEPKGYEAWADGQPDDGDIWTIEDCAHMWPGGVWNDNECHVELFYVCEYEPFK